MPSPSVVCSKPIRSTIFLRSLGNAAVRTFVHDKGLLRTHHFHLNVVADCFVGVLGVIDDDMIEDNRVGCLLQLREAAWNLGKAHSGTAKDLLEVGVAVDEVLLMRVLQSVTWGQKTCLLWESK